jgi:GTP pyrophosphokinase
MIRITDIIDKVTGNHPEADPEIIERAYVFSARAHEGQVRLSGEPYLSHPLEVAGILADMRLDPTSIASGLLHDVIEDTHATPEEIDALFGKEVAHIVSGVTKLSKLPFDSSEAREAENIRKMLLAMADDIRVILIKLADRIHNMRTLGFHKSESKQRKIAQETMDIYAPIASRLGIYWMKHELEDTAFLYLMPEEYERIRQAVVKDRQQRERYVEEVKGLIRQRMAESNLNCEVLGRYKYFYSIYQKMQKQNLDFENVYDIIAFRIILDSVPQCYEALGLVHSIWKPVAGKIKDYIAVPKPNMYQSLHTTVIGPYGERVEIQIRTWEMDRVARSGIAAHWSYKEGTQADALVRQRFAWIQNLVENQENVSDPNEFLENVRIDLFPEEVYVFTPRGAIKSLPRGASPVDFAYLIHSDIGHQCIGAKVNGRIVPLRYELQTGDVVEIITGKNTHPSKDWLSFVKTIKARSRIRQWVKTQEKERSVTLGREMCEKAFRKYKLNFAGLIKSEQMTKVVEEFGFRTLEDLLASVGYGKHTPLQIVRRFEPQGVPEASVEAQSILDKIVGRVRKKKDSLGVLVKGADDILIKFGQCCRPLPGDPIIGYITLGHGVTVHRSHCINALNMNPERRVDVSWAGDRAQTYPANIRIRSTDRVGLLADVAANISKHSANILSANTKTNDDSTVDSHFTLAVEDIAHLDRVLTALKKVRGVMRVKRIDV